jgi:fucose permease
MVVAFVAVATLQVEEAKAEVPPSIGSSLGLLKEPVFALAVLGIFLYVGAEVCMGRFLQPRLAELGLAKDKAALFGPTCFFLLLTIGRLLGGAVLTVMSPRACFRLSALLGMVGGLLFIPGSATLAIIGVFIGGLGFANIWPMLFSITVEEKPERSSELSGLMCMAISGGAVVPLLMGRMIDLKLGALAFLVPAACFGYLLLISLRGGKPAVHA